MLLGPYQMTRRPATLLLAFALAACAGCAHASTVERAQALVREHRTSDAVAMLREHLRVDAGDVVARRLLVRVLALAGDIDGARDEVQQLLRRGSSGDPMPFLELGHALELVHQYDEALAAYDEAASVAPSSPDGPREGGMRCARWGEAEAARPRLEEAVRRGARDPDTWHALGIVRMSLRDLDGAAEAYREGAAADARLPENWLGLATVAVARGDATKALEGYDQVLARRPRFAAAELGRAWALIKLGRAKEAERAIDRAEELGAPAANIARQRAALSAPPNANAK